MRCLLCGLVFMQKGVLTDCFLNQSDEASCRSFARRFLRRITPATSGRNLFDEDAPCRHFIEEARTLGWNICVEEDSLEADLVLLRGWLSRIMDPARKASDIRRRLKKGGILAVWDFSHESLNQQTVLQCLNLWNVESLTRLFGPYAIGGDFRSRPRRFKKFLCVAGSSPSLNFFSKPFIEWVARG